MKYLALLFAFIVLLPACSGQKQAAPKGREAIRWLSPEEFARVLDDTARLLVNAESAPEGEIPGTNLRLTTGRALDSIRALQPDVTRPVAVYCRRQERSDTIAAELARAGYSDVCVLRGGYRAWVEESLPFRLYPPRK